MDAMQLSKRNSPETMKGRTILGLAPEGCWYNDGKAGCSFLQWTPPLLDKDFGPGSVYDLGLHSITGDIPAGAFSGLNDPRTSKTTYIRLYCGSGKMTLSKDIFTPNLHWVTHLSIFDCYIENGLTSGLLEYLRSLRSLAIFGPNSIIDGLVASDTLAGLTGLQSISVNARVLNGELPSGFFDGLVNLTSINLRDAALDFIPLDWFNGLDILGTIYLSNNNLQTLPTGLFGDLRLLRFVWLENNPWNCSCELMWLLDWSDIEDGFVCQAPALVVNVKLEDALDVLGCIASTPSMLTTAVTSETETTAIQTNSFALSTISQAKTTQTATSGLMISRIATSLQMKWITSASFTLKKSFVTHVTLTASPTVLIPTATPKISTVTSSGIALTFQTVPPISWTPSIADDLRPKTTSLRSSPFPSANSTVHSTAKSGSTSRSKGESIDGILTDVRYIALISTIGTLIVLSIVAAAIYQYVRRNKYNGSMNRMDNNESDRHGEDPEIRDASNSNSTETP